MKQTKHPHFFAAVPLPDNIQSVLAERSLEWRERWPFRKWVHSADYHITLHFLGGCSPALVTQVKDRLTQITGSPFTIETDYLGFFGQRHKPRILWAGISGEVARLHRLRDDVVAALEPFGFPAERRPYRPHITLAKNYQGNHFPAEQLASVPFSQTPPLRWEVKQFVLYQTHLARTPMYEIVGRYAL